ncbi:uncharacterized protein LOC129003409 [Macrosteles quadrilineatus]|uniref:uncharacterized protein LOC129003409 n=1 Tax=Macrosteles quadrilineatus TaxID=74068 RepID=UPI0023E2DCFC|nr:uncharacterized protein LOC129003409 [Macrosteles quadrilineatus]
MVKAMEKIINRHVRDEILMNSSLNVNQHAFMMGKSTTTALHSLVVRIEDTLDHKEILAGVFMDIQGAFDNVSYQSIEEALTDREIPQEIVCWIMALLRSREISATVGDSSVIVEARRGCPQGGVLSPLLWTLVVDGLLREAEQTGIDLQAFADDLVLTVRGNHKGTIEDLTQRAVDYIDNWCNTKGLTINPTKTEIVTFTRKRRTKISPPQIRGMRVKSVKETKYLGVYLDQKLTWNRHIDHVIAKGTGAMGACRRTFGKKWGLNPRLIWWIYETIVKPMVEYAALVWWQKAEQTGAAAKLQQLQRLACTGVCGTTRSCPTVVMESILGALPLGLDIKKRAALTALKTCSKGEISSLRRTGHMSILRELPSLDMEMTVSDLMIRKYDFDKPYQVAIGDRGEWQKVRDKTGKSAMVFYTDGSRREGRSGLGVYGIGTYLSKALGETPTVFQAEVMAIEHCARLQLDKGLKRRGVLILSDSQAALKAIDACVVESKVVQSCRNTLKALSEHNRIQLAWIPGHAGHEGNERADVLAGEGAKSELIGPEPCCGVPVSKCRSKIITWAEGQQEKVWENTPGLRQSKMLINPLSKEWRNIFDLQKEEISLLIGLLTGHGYVRKYLKTIGLRQTDQCRFCLNETESAEHIWLECPALAHKRLKHLGKAFPLPTEIREMGVHQLIGFARKLRLGD